MRRHGSLALLALLTTGCAQTTATSTPAAPQGPPIAVEFAVDTAQNRHAISPYIYGINELNASRPAGLRTGRAGGNRWTAYNWETNASNAGADYHHQNDDFLGGGEIPG